MAKSGRGKSSGEEKTPKKVAPVRKKKAAAKHEPKKKPPAKVKAMPQTAAMGWRASLLEGSADTKKILKESENALVPYTIGTSNAKQKNKRSWPSTLFLDATYSRGILVDKNSDEPYFAPTPGYAENDNEPGLRYLPFLSNVEAKLWCHKHAAHTAVARRFPVEIGRLLGTITLEIQEKVGGKGKPKTDSTVPDTIRDMEKKQRAKNQKTKTSPFLLQLEEKRDPKAIKRITHKQASNEAATECIQTPMDATSSLARVHEIQEQWKAVQNSKPYVEPWDKQDGSFLHGKDDDNHVTVRALQAWLDKGVKAGTLVDLHKNRTKELYGGLTRVPIDATDILDALFVLADPNESSIYGVPLVTAYPRMERCSTDSAKKKGSTVCWKIQIGVYMHRLLPEIFCCQSLHIVMSALDEGSYRITQPLVLPPRGKTVFKSAPYPKVDTSLLEEGTDKSSKKKKNSPEIIDVDEDMEGGSREEMIVSPFSVKGLLKMLENNGCDVSNWPQIQQELRGKFKLDLLLHQQHAICWMIQMEHLKGAYGINSVLWEQRSFLDGGEYYYSPALGQIRLGKPPPHMKGGLLIDEQGCGKTVEVLGLIMATLPELKATVRHRTGDNYEGDTYYSAASEDEEEYITHTTLIVVPPALVGQWLHEIEKAVGKTTLTVCFMAAQSGEVKKCLPPPPNDNQGDKSEDEDDWDLIRGADILVTTYDALEKPKAARKLQDVTFARVVLDEMQEIASPTTKIAKNCEHLQCDRRWMLSGTPIYSGIKDLRGELNMLRLEPFGANFDDGFFDFAIQTPWDAKKPSAVATLQILCLLALRRSSSMTVEETGVGLLDLKPLTVEFVPVPQTVCERALYCFMECIVASELERTNKATKRTKAGSDKKSRALCLRLLRELCITPMLINGGLGVSSQLSAVNQLLIQHNRREMEVSSAKKIINMQASSARRGDDTTPVMSPDQALRFLTQHQETARTDSDMVTEMAVGGSRGASYRHRAVDRAEDRFSEAKRDIADAEDSLSAAIKKRAKARWHGLLEQITTGRVSHGRKHKFSGLWLWRRCTLASLKHSTAGKASSGNATLPELFTRGWRPKKGLVSTLFKQHPDFYWCHPHSIRLSNVPGEISEKELAVAMRSAATQVPLEEIEKDKVEHRLSKEKNSQHRDKESRIQDLEAKLQTIKSNIERLRASDEKVQMPSVVKVRERKHVKGFWKAVVLYSDADDYDMALSVCSRSAGAPLKSEKPIPHLEALAKSSKEKVEQIEAEFKVHPSQDTKKRLDVARKEAAAVSSGLRIVSAASRIVLPVMSDEMKDQAGTEHSMVFASKSIGALRSTTPRYASTLDYSVAETVQQSTGDVYQNKATVVKKQKALKKLGRALSTQVSEKQTETSAFGILSALIDGDIEKTGCPICLGYLGEDDLDEAAEAGRKRKHKQAPITMIKCGHFYCTSCISGYIHDKLSSHGQVVCPACRQPFTNDSIFRIDPSLKDEQEALKKEREAAKELVREAGKLLSDSNGILDAELWRALYLSFDLPSGVERCGDSRFTAIPREALTHLRGATGMKTSLRRSDRPAPGSVKGAGRCSKIQRLLEDLQSIIPKERCVIFSSSKECLMHLGAILKDDNIGFQAIYKGQSTTASRTAVTRWEQSADPLPSPCLLVQAGAAAAGLTLTAASKMFIMEPFQKQEQENQAYARCHRYSQKHKVSVKVYYTPVSVESRLLDWRRQGGKVGEDQENDADMREFQKSKTRVIIHEIEDDSSDEGSLDDSSDTRGSDSESEKKKEADDSHDIAQTNFLLGLLD
ncbi:DNA repair protein RAD5 [Seminavis robusta]|uniref:DNA repair protein RAD5 n=1 Tax=Seminavis robusta TaxID=568900 RepID=A0A9N8DRE4_9STRA|nr:DNA repair protein RAD5 [Seminavis robusta]|eukprot:Sro298_g111080.1 DNA repair protein RAD5 (1789) ;mRNA; r:28937-35188